MLNKYFLLFIVIFAYIQSIYSRIAARQQINSYTFTPEAAIGSLLAAGILFLIILYFIKKWQRAEVFSTKEMLKIFTASLITYMLIMQGSGFIIAFVFDNVERNFNQQTFILSLFSDFMDGVIYGSFFLVYYYYKRNMSHHRKLATYHEAMAASKIDHLKAQLNPHFLFNNLNILDQLIEEDKEKASDFLNEFAEIYRYVLQASDRGLVRVEAELEFAYQYFKLIQYKYEDAFQLEVVGKHVNGFIVPMTLQLLIENAIKHNFGTGKKPLQIRVEVGESIRISNSIQLKHQGDKKSGRGLRNLVEQYQLLSSAPISIHQSENEFEVIVPILQKIQK